MSNRIPDGTYVYAGPVAPEWERPSLIPTEPTTTIEMHLEPTTHQRVEALECEVAELKRALADLREHAEIKAEIAAVRAAMTELLGRMRP